MQKLHQKRENFRVSIRREQKQKMQAIRRTDLIRLMADSDDSNLRQDMLKQIIDTHFPQADLDLDSVTAASLFPSFKHLLMKPASDQTLVDYLYLLEEEMFMASNVCTEEHVEYVREFIHRVPYGQLQEHPKFRANFLNLIEQIVDSRLRSVDELKKKLLNWCKGTRSLRVISKCLSQFPTVSQYGHIFLLIEQGLVAEDMRIREQAARTVSCLGDLSDYDDMASIYHNYMGIFTNLVRRIMEATEAAEKELYGDALLKLCATYNEAVCCYGMMGLGDVGCQLMLGDSQADVTMGLRILSELAFTAKDETNMKEFLLRNPVTTEMWKKLGSLYLSPNVQNRKNVYGIILNMVDALNYDELVEEFLPQLQENLLKIIEHGLHTEQNPHSVFSLVGILKNLLYHSERTKELHGSNAVAAYISSHGVLRRLEEIANITDHSQTRQECEDILNDCRHFVREPDS